MVKDNLRGAIGAKRAAAGSRQRLSVMSEKPLKIVPAPEAKTAPAAEAPAAEQRAAPRAGRKRLRMVLLVVIPLIAAAAGGYILSHGRPLYSTDNAYVGAQKVLITPEISGKVNQSWCARASASRLASIVHARRRALPVRLQQAEAKLDSVRPDTTN